MAQQSQVAVRLPLMARIRPEQGFLVWLGVAPFLIFAGIPPGLRLPRHLGLQWVHAAIRARHERHGGPSVGHVNGNRHGFSRD